MRIKDLKKEVKANIPDLSDKISAMTDWQSIALNSVETNKKINQAAKKPIKKSWSFAFAAIAAVLVMAIVLPVTLNNKTAPVVAKADYEVVIEVKNLPRIRRLTPLRQVMRQPPTQTPQ